MSNTQIDITDNGTKTLLTAGKYCDRNIDVNINVPIPNAKSFDFTSPAAVAESYITVVSGDADVAAHYADENAMVVVRKMTNNNTNGLAIIVNTNHTHPNATGFYMNYNKTSNNAATVDSPLIGSAVNRVVHISATESGDIIVKCARTQNNFGGADYIVTFYW